MSLRVAVVGAGPAGIYASDLPLRNDEHDIHVDLFEQMPAPFGLIRYGVALDISRILAKTGDELLVTEIPDKVYESLKNNKAETVHMFGRRGPAQAKFTPKELREMDLSDTIQVLVDPEDIDYDATSEEVRRADKSVDLNCQVLEQYAMREPDDAPHKIYIHFFEEPVEVLTDDSGAITGLRTERQELDGNGGITGTGKFTDWPVQQVYHAVGYRSEPVDGVPFDVERNVIPNDGGHVLETIEDDAGFEDKLYVTGWIKRGPIGLIGSTKSNAKETTDMLIADASAGKLATPSHTGPDEILELLDERNIPYTTWDGWYRLDEAERKLGEQSALPRERKKIVEWEEMVEHARAGQ